MGANVDNDHDTVQPGIDWLTVTASSDAKRPLLRAVCEKTFEAARAQGEDISPWHFLNYAGYKAFGVRWGSRMTDDIAIVSGDDAQRYWDRLAVVADNCSRIDLAVTVFLDIPHYDVARNSYESVRLAMGSRQMTRVYTLLDNTSGGQTLYIGSRSSDQFGRLYDKGVILKPAQQPGRVWRYEVEFKSRRANTMLNQIVPARSGRKLPASIHRTVHHWFTQRAVIPCFDQDATAPEFNTELEAHITTDDMRMDWMGRQVAPAARRLVERGFGEQLRIMFGLETLDS